MNSTSFTAEISDWKSWSEVFQSIEAFTPLIREIYHQEGLPFSPLKLKDPGTHGVFLVNDTIIKLYVPIESGYNSAIEAINEAESLQLVKPLGLNIPKIVGSGQIQDRYLFRYLIMEFIDFPSLLKVRSTLSFDEKVTIGQNLRELVEQLHQIKGHEESYINKRVCGSFRWKHAPKPLLLAQERAIKKHQESPVVFVHADLTADNLLVKPDGTLVLLDFADQGYTYSLIDHMPILCDAFAFDQAFIQGYYPSESMETLAVLCAEAMLLHEFGYQTIKQLFEHVETEEQLIQTIFNRLTK